MEFLAGGGQFVLYTTSEELLPIILNTRRKERAMSIESARLFMERMKKDEEFRNRVIAGEDNEARLTLVKSEGFDFTKDELLAVHGELSDAELDEVAGGQSYAQGWKGWFRRPGIFCRSGESW